MGIKTVPISAWHVKKPNNFSYPLTVLWFMRKPANCQETEVQKHSDHTSWETKPKRYYYEREKNHQGSEKDRADL